MKQSQTKTGKTVFHTVMQPLVVLILLQAAILLTFLYLSGVFDQVNSNERAILSKQVANRANYLESQMTPAMGGYRRAGGEHQRKDAGRRGCGRAFAGPAGEQLQGSGQADRPNLHRYDRDDVPEQGFRHLRHFQYLQFGWQHGIQNGFPRARPRPDGERDDAVQRPFAGMCADLDRQGDEHRDRHGLGYAL